MWYSWKLTPRRSWRAMKWSSFMKSNGLWFVLWAVLVWPSWGQPRIREDQINWKAPVILSASRHVHDGTQGAVIYAATLETDAFTGWVGGDQQAFDEYVLASLLGISTVTGAVVVDGQAVKWRNLGSSGKQPYIAGSSIQSASLYEVGASKLRWNVGTLLLGGGGLGSGVEPTEFFGAADNYIAYWDQTPESGDERWISVPVTGDLSFNKGFWSIAAGKIVNASISASAAIALSKLAQGASGEVLISNAANIWDATVLSGDVKVVNTGVVTIQPNAVALSTDTTGNYVASVTEGAGITVTPTTYAEGAAVTVVSTLGTAIDSAEITNGAIVNEDISE